MCVGQRGTCQNLGSSLPRQLLLAYSSYPGQCVCICVCVLKDRTPCYLKSDTQLLGIVNKNKYLSGNKQIIIVLIYKYYIHQIGI